eukprot:GHVL01044536.1.p1 GENE.GHVL01044536.1~~GHVL01044536.1.p1  ORF type:complete len:214 (-),score=18.73 GHVL01044536.1:80-721(-)
MTSCLTRISKEYEKLLRSPLVGVKVQSFQDSLIEWKCSIAGPQGCPFSGFEYDLMIDFPECYPMKPPRVKFIVPVFHPNVNSDGSICLSLITTSWSPTLGVANVLVAIQSLLLSPKLTSPANEDAASLYLHDLPTYTKRVYKESLAKCSIYEGTPPVFAGIKNTEDRYLDDPIMIQNDVENPPVKRFLLKQSSTCSSASSSPCDKPCKKARIE